MKGRTIKYLCKEGIIGLWKNRLMALASTGTIVLCLLILGMSYSIASNIEHILGVLETQMGITAYIHTDITEDRVSAIEKQIQQIPDVLEITYISKEEALRNFSKDQGDNDLFAQFQQDNPLPASFGITVENIDNQPLVVAALEKIPELQVSYFEKETSLFIEINHTIQLISFVIISCLICIALLLIVNTIKLTVYVRRREINIMKYIGATDSFIRLPFVVEGILIGTLGGLIPTAVIAVLYNKLSIYIGDVLLGVLNGVSLRPCEEIIRGLLPIYFVLGIGIGTVGSCIAIRKHLKV